MNYKFAHDEQLKDVTAIRKSIVVKRQEKGKTVNALRTVAEIMEGVKLDLRAAETHYATMQQIGAFVAVSNHHHKPTLPCAPGDIKPVLGDIWGVLRVILGDEVILQGIERYVAGREGTRLSMAEREAKLAKHDGEIHDLEVQEERAILALEDRGFTVLRRADVNGQVLREVWSAYKPEVRSKVPAKPLGLPKPKGVNDDNASVSGKEIVQ